MDKSEFIKNGFTAISGLNGSWILHNKIETGYLSSSIGFTNSDDMIRFLQDEFETLKKDSPEPSEE